MHSWSLLGLDLSNSDRGGHNLDILENGTMYFKSVKYN